MAKPTKLRVLAEGLGAILGTAKYNPDNRGYKPKLIITVDGEEVFLTQVTYGAMAKLEAQAEGRTLQAVHDGDVILQAVTDPDEAEKEHQK